MGGGGDGDTSFSRTQALLRYGNNQYFQIVRCCQNISNNNIGDGGHVCKT
jgi:hypothetical protein